MNSGLMIGHRKSVATSPAATREALQVAPDWLLTVGQETTPRLNCVSSFAQTTQILRLTFFTARKTETSTQVRVACQAGYSGTGPTLVRFGLFAVDAADNLTLIASTPNDTSLLAAAVAYTKSWSVPVAVIAGVRYAFGVLVVTTGTPPVINGLAGSGNSPELAIAPRVCAFASAQTDLPASLAVGSIAAATAAPYAALLP